MKEHIRERTIAAANYTLDTRGTVRDTAEVLNVSKSTVHKDLVVHLPKLNKHLASAVREVLHTNKSERHMRGGLATQLKYKGEM